ncbi:MAG: endonuclease/exonuclease/phosphatase family protein [Myxococcales bacterium]|nr:endonuclease/exonuclease/phosphatase family protein [Myxococcales bacterium]
MSTRIATLLGALATLTLGCTDAWLNGNHDSPMTDEGGAGGTSGSQGGGPGEGGGAAVGGHGGATTAQGDASIITWNLESFPLAPQTPEVVVSLFAELQPDVVAVQEVDDVDAFHAMVDDLDGYSAILNDDPGAFIRVGLIYREDRVVVDGAETLFPTDWWAFPRPPLKAHVRFVDTSVDFWAVVLHLKAKVDQESWQRRLDAAERLDTWLRDELVASEDDDFMLLGDFNDEVTDPPEWNVFNVFLDDPETYQFLTLPVEASGDYSYIPFARMIDHMLITSDLLEEVTPDSTEVLHLDDVVPGYTATVSDHRPVRTWLDLPPL